jgi:hypothetical protein
VKLPFFARNSLNQQTRIIVNEYAHSSYLDIFVIFHFLKQAGSEKASRMINFLTGSCLTRLPRKARAGRVD